MTTQNNVTVIHHPEDKRTTTTVTFDIHTHQEGEPGEWGALTVELETHDGNGGRHLSHMTHILTTPDWREKAASIRQAFRSATFRR